MFLATLLPLTLHQGFGPAEKARWSLGLYGYSYISFECNGNCWWWVRCRTQKHFESLKSAPSIGKERCIQASGLICIATTSKYLEESFSTSNPSYREALQGIVSLQQIWRPPCSVACSESLPQKESITVTCILAPPKPHSMETACKLFLWLCFLLDFEPRTCIMPFNFPPLTALFDPFPCDLFHLGKKAKLLLLLAGCGPLHCLSDPIEVPRAVGGAEQTSTC